MAKAIFRLDDGSVYHFDADTKEDARRQWLALLIEDGEADEVSVLENFGEPEITRVQLAKAAEMEVVGDGPMVRCERCCGTGKVEKPQSLLEVWQNEQKLPPKRRARQGAICNSEWP